MNLSDKFTVLTPNPDSEDEQWELEDIQAAGIPAERVWTVVEGDDSECSQWCSHGEDTPAEHREPYEEGHRAEFYALTGYHLVNRLYYLVAAEPWSDADSDIEYIA
jgi:hypothetical protein